MGMVTPESTAKAKERALSQGVQVWVLEPGRRYVSPSRTNDGIAYEVIIRSQEQNDITCSCPGATHRGICKHIGAIMVRLEAGQPPVNDHLKQDIADLYYR
jgi:uncharacterized Zn finger protein